MVTISARVPTTDFLPSRTRHSEVEARLLRCFDAAPADLSDALTPLLCASRAYAHDLRNQGVRPEELVMALKTLLCCHGGFVSVPSLVELHGEEVPPSGVGKYARVLDWCLEAFFDDVPRLS